MLLNEAFSDDQFWADQVPCAGRRMGSFLGYHFLQAVARTVSCISMASGAQAMTTYSVKCHWIQRHADINLNTNEHFPPPPPAISFQSFNSLMTGNSSKENKSSCDTGIPDPMTPQSWRDLNHAMYLFQIFVPYKGIKLGRDSVTNEPRSFSKLQPDKLFVLQLADNAIVDRQPINIGNEQLAGQEATLIYQGIIWLCDVIFFTTCMENEAEREEKPASSLHISFTD